MPATIWLLSQTVTKKILLHTYLIKWPRVEDQHRSEEHAYRRSNRVLEYRHRAMRARLACHGTALYCTHACELYVLRMRTLTIQYPDPCGKSVIPNKENSPPCPGWGRWGLTLIGTLVFESSAARSVVS